MERCSRGRPPDSNASSRVRYAGCNAPGHRRRQHQRDDRRVRRGPAGPQRAARLPRVEVRKPPQVIGQTTVNAMQSGLFFGYVEMVDGLVRRMRAELPGGAGAAIIATGGLADVISGESAAIQHVDPNLTLDGLRLIWDRAQPKDLKNL